MSIFRAKDFKLASGQKISELEVAYECYGRMSSDKDNVILVAHGITSSHIAAGQPTLDRRRGWYSEVIGPGKLFDTDCRCIISSNILGSCYGSTGPASLDPNTGRRYRESFPDICYEDIVRAQYALLTSLGITKLAAVAGSSIGGFQAFQWAVTYPEYVSAVLALDTAPRDTFYSSTSVQRLIETFSTDPNWNDGDYPDGSMVETLTELRIETLRSYGFEEKLGEADADKRQTLLFEAARDWAREFDAHSLVALTRAWSTFNVEDEFSRIKAPLLYVLCDTDEWFPASLGADVMAKLDAAGVDAHFHEVRSDLGHYATTEESDKWVPVARDFLNRAA